MAKILKVFVFCFIAIAVITGINYYVDSYAAIRITYDEIAQISEKYTYYVGTDIPLSERKAKWARINRMQKQEILVLGSSRTLMLTKEDIQEECFYNMSVSGGSCVNDYLAETYILYFQNKLPDKMLIEVSPAAFNANNGEYRYLEWGDNAEYMKQMLNGLEPDVVQPSMGIQWKDLFSPAYFQYNYQNLIEGKRVWIKTTDMSEHSVFSVMHIDGSYMYSKDYQQRFSEEDIKRKTEDICKSRQIYGCSDFREIDSEFRTDFEALILFLQKEGVEVSFYLPPYSSQMYEFIMQEKDYEMIPEVEKYILDFAEERGIKVYGSYNPEKSGLIISDFYDPYHIRSGKIMSTLWKRN